jgi:hypothetical protein
VFTIELRAIGNALEKSGKRVIVDEEKRSLDFEGVEMRLIGSENRPYTLFIKGSDERSETIKDYIGRFSLYSP